MNRRRQRDRERERERKREREREIEKFLYCLAFTCYYLIFEKNVPLNVHDYMVNWTN